MQLVDRGLIGLDDDVGKHVPYLADVKVIAGFDDSGKGIFEEKTKPITLR
jgi:CubicO group peptidase (beta-lactamase class C family)